MENNKRSRARFLTLFILLFVMITGAGIAYANRASLMNSYFMMTKNPKEYYTYVEKYGLYRLMTTSPETKAQQGKEYAFDSASTVTFHREELDSVLLTAFGISLSDAEKLLGIPFRNIGFDTSLVSKKHRTQETFKFKLNDTKLLTADLLLDYDANVLSLQVPELSEAYLTHTLGDDITTEDSEEALPSSSTELLEKITNRYLTIFFTHISNVTLTKQVPLSIKALSTECNQLTVTLSQEGVRSLAASLFESARTDTDIFRLLKQSHVTKEQYFKVLDELEKRITQELQEHKPEDTVSMKLYVDKQGHILGRELTSFGLSTLGYISLSEDMNREYDFHLVHAATGRLLSITGENRGIGEYIRGSMSLLLRDPARAEQPDTHVDLTYKDVRNEWKDGHSYLNGEFALSSAELMGLNITSDFNTEAGKQLNTTSIRLGASPLVTIDSTIIPRAATLPGEADSNAPRYDISQYDQYLAGINPKDYLRATAASLGIDPDRILGLYQYAGLIQ